MLLSNRFSALTPERIRVLESGGHRLNELARDCATRMARQNFHTVRGALEDTAERLRMIAEAEDLRMLCREQIATLPQSRDRLLSDAISTWRIFAGTGRELSTLTRTVLSELAKTRRSPTSRAARAGGKRTSTQRRARATRRAKS